MNTLRSLSLISLIFCSVGILSGCDQTEKSVHETGLKMDIELEKQRLRQLKEVDWPKAYREQDTVLLDKILGEDFQMITNVGTWSDKAEQLEIIKEAPMGHDSFRFEIKRLEVLDNGTAIVAGTGHIMNDSIKTIYQSSNVLVLRNGEWKAVLSHVSGVQNVQ